MIINDNNALIGYSGFVGSNILSQHKFENLYDIKNIEDIKGEEFNLVVCAAAPGIKWLANKKPEEDYNSIKRLMDNLKKVYTENFVLISTIDVYPIVDKVNEDTQISKEKLSPYGKHRRMFEEFVETYFNSLIIRLPGIFGKGLKGNIIYDFLYKRYDFIPKDGIFQFYCLNHIWKDIFTALKNNLKTLNISTEPISISELSTIVFDFNLSGKRITNKKPYYDMHSKYGHIWGKEGPYLYSKNEILSEIKDFVKKLL